MSGERVSLGAPGGGGQGGARTLRVGQGEGAGEKSDPSSPGSLLGARAPPWHPGLTGVGRHVFGRNAGAARRPRVLDSRLSCQQAVNGRTLVLISVASVFGAILTQPSAYGRRQRVGYRKPPCIPPAPPSHLTGPTAPGCSPGGRSARGCASATWGIQPCPSASLAVLSPSPSGRARRPSCGFFSRSSRTHDPVHGFACPPQWMATFLGVTTTARRTHMHVHTRTCTGARTCTCTCTCTHAHARAGPSHHKQHATHGVASSLYGAGSR